MSTSSLTSLSLTSPPAPATSSPTPASSLTSLSPLSPLASTLPPAAGVTSLTSLSAAPPLSRAAAAAANRLSVQQTAATKAAAAKAAAAEAEAAAAALKDVNSTKFMSSWEVYDWENYNLDTTSDIEKVIETFKDLDPKNLTHDIVDNSILELTQPKAGSGSNPEINFFNYLETFKKIMTTEEGIASKQGWFGTSGRSEREKFFKNQLTSQHVVSLLTRDKKPMGICYSECDPTSSKIEDSSFGARRLICKKKINQDVKIAFFPGHPLGYLFFDGRANFNEDGNFMGLGQGKLLKKNNGTKLYDVFNAHFTGDVVVTTAGITNVLSQYSYDTASASAAAASAAASASSTALVAAAAPVLKLEGYAYGEIGWNLNAPVPVYMASLPSVTCLNWNFGQDVVKTYIDDDRPSTCKEMLYTTHHGGLDTPDINGLFTKACSSIDSLFKTTQVPLHDSKRKVDFIVKKKYQEVGVGDTEFTLYKLRCKISDDACCVIELAIPTNSSDTTRIRIYICYGLNDTSQGKPKIIRERSGLFFAFDSTNNVAITANFLRINEYVESLGINFEGIKSVPKLPKKQFKEIVKKFPETYTGTTDDAKKKMDERCNARKDSTETAFNFSMLCAVATYNLLLSPNGVVSELLKGLAAPSSNELLEIKQSLKNNIDIMISRVKDLLPKALEFAKNTPTPEFYINNGMFDGLVPPSSALLGSLPPSTVKPTDFDVVDFDIGGTLLSGIYIPTDIFGNASVAGVGVAGAAAAAVPSIIYFDKHATSYVIKRDHDTDISNLSKSTTVLTPNVGTYVIVGDNVDIRTMRPGIITSLDKGGTTPLTIKYIRDISTPTTTEFNYDSATDSQTHSAKKLISGAAITKKIWLCVPSSMIPASSVPILTGASAPPPPSSGAAGGQKFNIGDKVLVVGDGTSSSQPAVVENLLKTPNQVYKVAVYDAANNSYKIKTTLGVDKFYDDIPESNLGPAPPPPPPPSSGAATVVTFTQGDVVLINNIASGSDTKLNGRVGVFINTTMSAADANVNVNIDGTYTVYGIPIANLTQVMEGTNKVTVAIPTPGGLVPVLEVGGIARVSASSKIFSNEKVSLDMEYKYVFKVSRNGISNDITKTRLTPLYSAFDVKYSTNGSVDLLAGGGGRSRIRGTRKYQKRHRRGNMRRRITRKIKRSRRGGVVHRGGGGRGGKIYRKTRKHVRGGRRGRGGRGHGGHRRTIKKYHRR